MDLFEFYVRQAVLGMKHGQKYVDDHLERWRKELNEWADRIDQAEDIQHDGSD